MTDQKDRKPYQLNDKEKELYKPGYNFVTQYDEEDDFLCGKVSNYLPEFTEEE